MYPRILGSPLSHEPTTPHAPHLCPYIRTAVPRPADLPPHSLVVLGGRDYLMSAPSLGRMLHGAGYGDCVMLHPDLDHGKGARQKRLAPASPPTAVCNASTWRGGRMRVGGPPGGACWASYVTTHDGASGSKRCAVAVVTMPA